jgi:hypothetical protein
MFTILVVVLGVVILLTSLIANVLLYKAGERQMLKADLYEEMYKDIVLRTKGRIMETYLQMKQLDDKEIFSKDDDVGIAFKEILSILQELNEITQEEESKQGE